MHSFFVVTLGDVVGISLSVIGLVIAAIYVATVGVRQRWCKHDGGVHETMACDAVCLRCGKNLGFIGAWRDKHGPNDKVSGGGTPSA